MSNVRNLILEGLHYNHINEGKGLDLSSFKGAVPSTTLKNLNEREIKSIFSNIYGNDYANNQKSIDLNDRNFRGVKVDIVGVDRSKGFNVYDIEIKKGKNNFFPSMTKDLKSIGATKYTNGYMLTGFESKSDADKFFDILSSSRKSESDKIFKEIKKVMVPGKKMFDYEEKDTFEVLKASGNDLEVQYSDGFKKKIDLKYVYDNTDILDEID